MATYPPPREYVPIFNPEDWEYAGDAAGISQAAADLRYLLKNATDTATALETFAAGILTNTITGIGGNLVLGSIGGTVTIYGNTIVANVSNLDVTDAQITVNKNGVSPLNAGLQVESGNAIVSSLLNDANADWVLSSSNNRIYLDQIRGSSVGNVTISNSNLIVTTNGNNKAEVHPTYVCVNDGAGNITGFQLQAGHGCAGTQNALDFQLKTNNTNRMDIDGTNGNIRITSTLPSTSSTTGALVVEGGLGVNGNLFASGNVSAANISTSGTFATTGNLTAGNISTVAQLSVGTNMTVTGQGNITGVLNCGTGTGTSYLNYGAVQLLGSSTTTNGLLRFTKAANVNYIQSAVTNIGGNFAPLIITAGGTIGRRWMTVTDQGVMIGNTIAAGTVPVSNLYVLGNALITSNLLVQSNITATARIDAPTAIVGDPAAYGVFLNTSIGASQVGVAIENSGLGNTVIQPQQQGVAWRNTYINPNGGLLSVGSSTPPSAAERLYVNGIANISGQLFTNGQTVNLSASTVEIKSLTGTGTVQQLLNFNTHQASRGGGMLYSQPDANVKQFFGRAYVGGSSINGIYYNTTTTGGDVYTAADGITKFVLFDTGNLQLNGNANINGSLNVVGNIVGGNLVSTGSVSTTGNVNIGNLFVSSYANIRGPANVAGIFRIESTQDSFATSNGALVVSGGCGINGSINMGGNLNAAGALITSQNGSTALQVTGSGWVTGTLTSNQFTSNNVVSGNLLIGGGTLSEGCKCVIRNNVVDTVVNGTTLGNAVNLIEMENPSRSWYFGTSGSGGDQFYIGSSGGAANDPDYLFYLDTGGRLMAYPPVTGAITGPNTTDIFTARGNANISGNCWVGGNIISTTDIITPAMEITGTGANALWVGGDANVRSANIRGALTINSGASGPGEGNVTITNDFNNANLTVNGVIRTLGVTSEGSVVVGNAGPLNFLRTPSIQFVSGGPRFVFEKGINASGVNAITFASNFNATPTLQITPVDTTNSSVTAVIVNVDMNGANVNFKNSANSTISRAFHWFAMGNVP